MRLSLNLLHKSPLFNATTNHQPSSEAEPSISKADEPSFDKVKEPSNRKAIEPSK